MDCGQKNRTTRGFTLVEIVVSLSIIAIIAGIAVPSIIDWLPEYRLRAAARALYSDLQQAKQEAVRTNGECSVYFDIVNGGYQLVGGGADGVCEGNPEGNPPKARKDDVLMKKVAISNYGSSVSYGSGKASRSISGTNALPVEVTYSNDRVRFNSKGMAREMGYVYLTNCDGTAYGVGTPSLSGVVVMKKWQGGKWD